MRKPMLLAALTGATLAAISVAGAKEITPAPQAVITAPAPIATLLDPGDIELEFRGGDLTLQNDTLTDGSGAALQFGFANGEIGAATFNIDPGLFPVQIKKIQVYWSSALANGTQSLQDAIIIYTGNFNAIANLEGPVMTDGVLNEFDLTALGITVNSATPITVGLQFFDAPNGDALKGTLATDTDGCQGGKNWVFIPGANNWFNICAFGVSGDLVIRAVIDPMGSVAPCPADVNGDDVIDTADLGLLIAVFGQAPPSVAEADINEDGVCDTADLGLLIAAFGTSCP